MAALLAFGDSFVRGDELSDFVATDDASFSRRSWPARLATALGREYICDAFGGRANETIAIQAVRRITQCLGAGQTQIVVIVAWTFPERHQVHHRALESVEKTEDFKFSRRFHFPDYPLVPLTPWTLATPDEKIKHGFPASHRAAAEKEQRALEASGIAEVARSYFTYGNSQPLAYQRMYKDIIVLQAFLGAHTIPYAMTFSVGHGWFAHPDTDPYIDLIDKSAFIPGDGLLPLAKARGLPFGASHPLDEAHELYAQLALPFVKQRFEGGHP